jgi:hypothetical protein
MIVYLQSTFSGHDHGQLEIVVHLLSDMIETLHGTADRHMKIVI